jgi:hypothetical protein
VNLPSLIAKASGEIVADDSAGSDHKCFACHVQYSSEFYDGEIVMAGEWTRGIVIGITVL